MTGPRLASLHIYPMKATRAVDLDQATVEPWGLQGDRRWLLIDADGGAVSQREDPALARVTVTYHGTNNAINVSTDGRPGCVIEPPGPDAPMLKADVWGSVVPAAAAGPEADAWFSAYLGWPVRLAYLDDPTRRPVDPEYGRPGDVVSFADDFPLLMTSTGSLDELNRWLAGDGEPPVPMTRFRPSAVVAGTAPWAEDRWRRVRIGAVPFRVAKPCGRCVVTTIDQVSGQTGRQPLKMLGRHRNIGQLLVFGQNLIPDASGVIRVGDAIEILEIGP